MPVLQGKTSHREIEIVSVSATQTRKSLVKGERFVRSVWMAEIWENGDCRKPEGEGPGDHKFVKLVSMVGPD